jgi:Ala-tRNA(Pro) deacylase
MAIPSSISEFLDRNQARYSSLSHPTAYTAQEEAAAAGVPGREWAKAVVCMADDRPILVVLAAPSEVDFERLKRLSNASSLRLAAEAELKQLYRDCEVGSMPPLGPLYGQQVFVDRQLISDPEIAFEAGSHHDAIRMSYSEFARLVSPTVGDFAAGPSVARARAIIRVADPVCGTILEQQQASGRSDFRSKTYYFCSQGCKMEFDDNPHAYARSVGH